LEARASVAIANTGFADSRQRQIQQSRTQQQAAENGTGNTNGLFTLQHLRNSSVIKQAKNCVDVNDVKRSEYDNLFESKSRYIQSPLPPTLHPGVLS
jgi:5-methylthioribose kinase